MEVRWLRRALRDLTDAADQVAVDDVTVAAKMVLRIKSTVALLADHQALGRPGRVPGTRELVVPDTPYLIPYRVRGHRVEILRVFHGHRRWPKQF